MLWCNGLMLLLVLVLLGCTQLFGPSVGLLFIKSFVSPYPFVGFLSRTFQILCCVPAILCTFSFSLLRTLQPQRPENAFWFYSALLTGGLMVNEIFRVHITLMMLVGIPKLLTTAGYSGLVLWYGLTFRDRIHSTPYKLLLTAVGLFLLALAVDSLRLPDRNLPALLEGIPKLFFMLNMSLYFWLVARQELLETIKN